MKITAKYKPKQDGWVDKDNPSMIYKVRELNESLTGKKRVRLWGWSSTVGLEEVDLMIDGKVVTWD
jgi:hypothetical protein